jgi:hypothetical protein
MKMIEKFEELCALKNVTAETPCKFHLGRGGRFNNAGFLTFKGFDFLRHEWDDLYPHGEYWAEETGKPAEVGAWDAGGNKISDDDFGSDFGRIEMDNDFDTTYVRRFDECEDDELKLIAKYLNIDTDLVDFGANEFEENSELLEKWIVVSIGDRIKITLRDNFEKKNLCDLYSEYGQKVGHYNAGDYHFDNSSSDAIRDCNRALVEAGLLKNTNEIVWYLDNEDACIEDLYGENDEFDKEAIEAFAKKWREDNESCTEVTAWTYHDSRNFRSIVIESYTGNTDGFELGEEESSKILAQMPGEAPNIEGTNESVETEDYIFEFDRWATNPWFCYVENK